MNTTQWRTSQDAEDKDVCILGKRGVIHDYGSRELDVWVKHLFTSNRLERQGWKAKTHYDDGALFIVSDDRLDEACRAIKAGKRRHLSPEVRKAACERLAKWHVAKKTPAQQGSSERM